MHKKKAHTFHQQHKPWLLKPYIRKYIFHFVFGLLALIVVDFFQLRVPVITGRIADGLEMKTMDTAILTDEVIWLLLVGVFITLGRFAWRYFIFGSSRGIEADIRNDYFAHLESLSMSFYNKNKTGELMAYATNDLNAVRMMIGPGILMAFDATVLTIMVLYQMIATIDIRLTVFAIIPLPIIAVGSLFLGKSIRQRFKRKQEAFAGLSDMVQESVSGIRVIKAYVQEGREAIAFNKKNQENYDKNLHVIRLQAIMMPLATMISGASVAIALGYGGYLVMKDTISLGDFVAFVQYLMMMTWPMIAVGWCINIMSQGTASLNRLRAIMNEQPEIKDAPEADYCAVEIGEIKIDHLTYTYPGTEEAVLKDIHIHIKPGETVGIIGKTGCGKTTLMDLLLRLYNPPKGTISIGGKDIYKWSVKSLRDAFGYVPQDNFLFSDTIANNISFGLGKVEQSAIMNAAKFANVHDNIVEFQKGYETVVGERGVTLSGGQKQRISIARAYLMDPLFLILDDAVSAVDTKTEEGILNAIKAERQDKTTMIIAHRISTIQHADQILVMDQGRIVEKGTHDDLIEQQGLYYKMVLKQQLEKSLEEQA